MSYAPVRLGSDCCEQVTRASCNKGSKSKDLGWVKLRVGYTRMDDLDVAAMLCSLMCHDLVSPVGALANGVEILEEEEDKKNPRTSFGIAQPQC